jgi:hypothetical protein
MLDITLGWLNVYSCSGIILPEELDLNDSFGVEALDLITLLSSINFVRLNCESEMLTLLLAFFQIIHDIIRFIFLLGHNPFFGQLVGFNVLLKVIPYGSWLNLIKVDVISHDIIESQTSVASLPD